MKKSLIAVIVISLLSFTIIGFSNASAQSFDQLYFPETGHWVKGKFLDYYKSVENGKYYFGYPITDEFIDPINGRTTQYFERARFDLIIDGYKSFVKQVPLGELLYKNNSNEISINESSSSCSYFQDTNKYICYAFLDFYSEHQGEDIFGKPISNLEWQDNRFVQYFEYARFEWHPASKTDKKIILTDLGKLYFDTRLGNQEILDPESSNTLSAITIDLKINVFSHSPLISNNQSQKIYIFIQNQHLMPVEGAMVKVSLIRNNSNIEVFRPSPTNEDGLTTLDFKVNNALPNEVIKIVVEGSYEELSGESTTWFRVWW